jgi:rubrerythrin
MGVSQRAAKDKQRKRIFKHYNKNATLPDNITTSEVVCSKCGFKARYNFLRCPQCDEVQK